MAARDGTPNRYRLWGRVPRLISVPAVTPDLGQLMAAKKERLVWEKVLDTEELAEGRVKPVTCHQRTI